jgi:hypothetical protein
LSERGIVGNSSFNRKRISGRRSHSAKQNDSGGSLAISKGYHGVETRRLI